MLGYQDAFIDCDGNCYSNVFLSSLGDGICDLGTIPGSPNLFCAERFYDFNDCYNPTLFGFPSGLPPPPTPLLSYALDSASVNKTFEGNLAILLALYFCHPLLVKCACMNTASPEILQALIARSDFVKSRRLLYLNALLLNFLSRGIQRPDTVLTAWDAVPEC